MTMKRDLDLIRAILLRLEVTETSATFDAHFEGHEDAAVQYHLYLLADAGFIDAANYSSGNDLSYMPNKITWAGQEFLNSARNATIWDSVKNTLRQRGLDVSIDVRKALLVQATMKAVGL